MPYAHYTAEEVATRGEALYEQRIRPHVEPTHQGQFVVVDIETGDYEIDAEDVQALQRAKAKHPDGAFYIVRIGAPTAYRLGVHRLTPAR